MDVAAAARSLTAELAALGTAVRADHDRAYLKSSYRHLGCTVPAVRSLARRWLRGYEVSHDELIALVDELWDGDVYDRRLLGVELLVASRGTLGSDDLSWIEGLLRGCRTWALVDPLAGDVVARIVVAEPAGLAVLDGWVNDDDFWVRRAAVLGLRLAMRDSRELDRFERYADVLLPEREFFIRKVLGWVARDTGRHHPEVVSAWVRANLHRMSGVTVREAVKHLPDGAELLAAWRRTLRGAPC